MILKVTKVNLKSNKVEVAEGSEVEDDAGKRKGLLMFYPGTEVTVVNGNQENQVLILKYS